MSAAGGSTGVVGVVPGLQQRKVFKIIVLGDSGVGKTCLTYRFCEGNFPAHCEVTIGVDFRERTVRIFGDDVRLQLWDTAGQERFRKSMVQHYYRNAHAVVIVYDVTKPTTFESVHGWMREVESHGLRAAPRVLVGNKCDVGSGESGAPAQRVSTARAQRLADHYTMPLFETSARLESESCSVSAVFLTLAHKLHSRQPLRLASVQEEFEGVVSLRRRRCGAEPTAAAPAPCCA